MIHRPRVQIPETKAEDAPLFLRNEPAPQTPDVLFDAGNPGVYAAFVAEAVAVKAAGFEHYSARTIVHVLRHHSAVRDGSGTFKLNDHLSPYLARRLMRERPEEFGGFFELRESRIDDSAA